ncbi:MAG: carboxymuconolactone decarboxylase family protein [Candidatus Thermoplasmatota archaeon]
MEEIPGFLKKLKEKDPDYAENILDMMSKNHEDTALSAKNKLLIAMALDAAHGDINGVKMLSGQARNKGATEQEILETAEVVGTTCGIQGLYIALKGLKEK